MPARYGYERLLIDLSRKLKEKIYVLENELREQYLMISGLSTCTATNKYESRIILSSTRIKLYENDQKNHLKIHLSAMFWANLNKNKSFTHKSSNDKLRICYATHSSLGEIREFLNFLKPKNVYPTVVPENYDEKMKMFKLIDQIVNSYIPTEQEVPSKKRFAFKRLRQK